MFIPTALTTFPQRHRVFITALIGALVTMLFVVQGCEKKTAEPPPSVVPAAPITVDDPALTEAAQQVWQTASGIVTTAMASVDGLSQSIDALLATPNDENLQAARIAWQQSHNAYQAFTLFIALGDSNPGLFGQLQTLDFAVDAYPIQPGFIDYFAEYSHSGIVNDIAMPLTADALREQHGLTDETDVSLGFHAIEYLLWGENGARPAADYQAISQLTTAQVTAGLRVVDLPSNRRRTLVRLLANLLTDDIAKLQSTWANPASSLAQNYQRLPAHGKSQLLVSAAHAWVLGVMEEIQHYPVNAKAAADAEADLTEPAETHNPFAGGNASALAAQLGILEKIILSKEEGIGQWAIPETERSKLLTSVRTEREALLTQDDAWPPQDKARQALIDTFIELLDVLSQDALSENAMSQNVVPQDIPSQSFPSQDFPSQSFPSQETESGDMPGETDRP